ncbi:MAG TPA: prepilin peptidase [Acidobacteriaceae bacterium]|jgi:leader peptidase (prepilin peptidase)/N-methyltransferase|nr:prepilin peptidase [Acidobacteriaceae bacterium]
MMHSEIIAVAVAILLGLIFGSFLNVCIVRLPAGESILVPRSHCRHCKQPVGAIDNIPVVSWLLLRGRCRACGASISWQYPLVEAATGILFAACFLHTGLTWQTLLDATAVFLLLGLAVMDAQTFLLPNVFTLGGIGLAIVLRLAQPSASHRWLAGLRTVADALAAALVLLLVRWVYRLARRQEGMGLGDVKLLAMMAALLGLPLALVACFLAVLAGAGFSAVQVVRGKASTQDMVPFGSFLAGAGIATIFAGPPLLRWYLGFFR